MLLNALEVNPRQHKTQIVQGIMSVSVKEVIYRGPGRWSGHVVTGAPRVDRRKWKAFKFVLNVDACKRF